MSVVRLTVAAAAIGAVAATLIGYAGPWGYPFETFSHFRLQWAVAALAAGAAAAAYAMPRLAGAALVAMLANVISIGWALHDSVPPLEEDQPADLTIVWANVHGKQDALDQLMLLAREEGAGVVAITEAPFDALEGLSSMLSETGCADLPADRSPFAVAIVARGPCGPWGTASPEFQQDAAREMGAPGGLSVVAVHPYRPLALARAYLNRERQNSLIMRRDALILAAAQTTARPGEAQAPLWLERREREGRLQAVSFGAQPASGDRPAVLVGDFNATPWSGVMKSLRGEGLRPIDCGAPFQATWKPFGTGLIGLPIDLAYANGGVAAARCRVGPDIGSDHAPLIIEVALSQ